MNKKQLDYLSASLSKAINPAARKLEATAKILEHIEPLPVVSKSTHEESVNTRVENSMAKLTTVVKSEPSPWPMATVAKTATVAELSTHDNLTTRESMDNLATLANLAESRGELRVPNTIIEQSAAYSRARCCAGLSTSLPAVARIQEEYLPRRSAKARKRHQYQPKNCAARH